MRYRREEIGPAYRGWLHFGFTSAVSLGVILLSISRLEGVGALEWLTIPLVLLYANLAEYLAVPSVLACGGSWLTPKDAITAGDFDAITKLAAEAVAIAAKARG